MLFVLTHLTLQTLWMMIIIGFSFFIRKNDTVVVLSIICRFTTVVHRAEQDLSVFLWRFNCSEDWSLVILISFICLPGLQCKFYGRWHCLIKRWTPFNWQLWIVPIIGVWCLKLVFFFAFWHGAMLFHHMQQFKFWCSKYVWLNIYGVLVSTCIARVRLLVTIKKGFAISFVPRNSEPDEPSARPSSYRQYHI